MLIGGLFGFLLAYFKFTLFSNRASSMSVLHLCPGCILLQNSFNWCSTGIPLSFAINCAFRRTLSAVIGPNLGIGLPAALLLSHNFFFSLAIRLASPSAVWSLGTHLAFGFFIGRIFRISE